MDPDFVSGALLRSLVESPSLVGDLPEGSEFPHRQLRLPGELPRFDVGQKLGHLCEDALAALLEATPRFDLLRRNLQVQKDPHTTVGEIDFLVRDREVDRLLHLELAAKFYLAVETEGGLALPGPDARDSYFKKLDRLRSHQLTLAERYRRHLPDPFSGEPVIAQHLIHGCLFDHIHAAGTAMAEFVHPHCRRGRWLRFRELFDHFPSGARFERIPKPLWPVRLELLEQTRLERWEPSDAVDRCVMLRVKGEALPYLVTPDRYPELG